MADNYRPPDRSEYNFGRRVSYPNQIWRREPSPREEERRPPGPPRSNTMDASRDPRQKRRPSRSPDGGSARKQLKPGQPRENAGAQPQNNSSRRSSISNETPTRPNGIGSSPNRGASGQPCRDANRDKSNTAVNSPKGRDSPMANTSGRSTPLGKANGMSIPAAKAITNGNSLSPSLESNSTLIDSDLMSKLLSSFNDDMAKRVVLQISRDQAKTKKDRRQLEYNSTRDKHDAFPAIKERQTADKNAAVTDFNLKDRELEEHKKTHEDSQKDLMTKLVTTISQNIKRTDQPSRAEYDSLTKKLNDATDLIENLRTELGQVKVNANAAKSAAERFTTLQNRVNTIESETAGTFKKLEGQISANSNTAKTFIAKDDIDKLEAKLEQQTISKLDQHDKKVTELKNNVAKWKAESVTAAPRVGSSALSDDVKKKIDSIESTNTMFVDRVEKLEISLTQGASRIETKQEEDSAHIQKIWAAVFEEGKEPLNKRIEQQDALLKRLSTKVEAIQPDNKPPIQEVLNKFEEDKAKLQLDLKNLESTKDPRIGNGDDNDVNSSFLRSMVANVENGSSKGLQTAKVVSMEDRLKYVEEDVESTRNTVAQQMDDIARFVQEKIDKTVAHISTMKDSPSDEVKHLRETVTTLEKNLKDIEQLASRKASIEQIEGLRTSQTALQDQVTKLKGGVESLQSQSLKDQFTKLQGELESLQSQQEKLRKASQTPMQPPPLEAVPSNQTPSPQQMPNGIVQPQILPNGMNGFAPTYAPPPHRHSSLHGMNQFLPNSQPDIRKMQQQVDGLVSVTQDLKQRYDNIQTDEVVRRMADQMSQMYPQAKGFEAAVNSMKATMNKLRKDFSDEQAANHRSIAGVNKSVGEAKKDAGDAKKDAADSMRAVTNMNSTVSGLEDQMIATSSDVQTVKGSLSEVKRTAEAADKLSKTHSERLHKVQPEELKKTVGTINDNLGAATSTVHGELTAMHGELDAVKDTLAELLVRRDNPKQ